MADIRVEQGARRSLSKCQLWCRHFTSTICILLLILPLVIFTVNDYSFFGLSWSFYGLLALRLVLVAYTILLLISLKRLKNYRSYDRAEFLWGLFFAIFVIIVNATRPATFITNIIVIVLAVFITVLAIPNRFTNQLILSLVYTVGETLIIAPSLLTSPQASVTVLLSMFIANTIAIATGWLLHSLRRREFLTHEEVQSAKAEAEIQLAEHKRVEEALHKAYENLQVQSEELQAQSEEIQMQSKELQEANETLRKSEERYRMLFTNMTDAFYLAETISDKDGKP
jgi:two-component system, sensor histidine kinase PdtaS